LLVVLFDPEDGGDMLLRNVGLFPNYVVAASFLILSVSLQDTDRINLAQDRDKWRVLVNTVILMNLRVS
jgi:hypothetical protein